MNFEIFCDECRPELFSSSVLPAAFLSIGGVWLPAKKRGAINNSIKQIRGQYKVWGEIKWNKVAPNQLDFYHEIVDFFFKEPELRFRTILVDAEKIDLLKYHQNDAELGFYKFYYQLIHHWILDFNTYRIFVDLKTNRAPNRLETLRRVLINSNLSSSVQSVQSLPSTQVSLIQLADLLTGLVNAALNRVTRSKAKLKLIRHVESIIGHPIAPTSKTEEKFNVFKINLAGGW